MLQGYNKDSIYLKKLFKKLFENKVDDVLETRIHGKLSLWMINWGDKDFLEDFVQEYFIMREKIVDNRDTLVYKVISKEYKEENLINKLKVRLNLIHWDILCERINKFELAFFQKTKISLLGVKNEMQDRAQKEKMAQNI